jgi:antitoxin HicB
VKGKFFQPSQNQQKKNEVSVELTPSETVKVLFLNSIVETKTKPIQIARRLGIAKQEVTRILNPRQKTKIDTLEKAIEATGKKLTYSIT